MAATYPWKEENTPLEYGASLRKYSFRKQSLGDKKVWEGPGIPHKAHTPKPRMLGPNGKISAGNEY